MDNCATPAAAPTPILQPNGASRASDAASFAASSTISKLSPPAAFSASSSASTTTTSHSNKSPLVPQVKDSFWLQLEVCREFRRSRCSRGAGECKFAHPPPNVDVQPNGRVVACYDSIRGRCSRTSCKYLHPPSHLRDQLLVNGRNHLALKNAFLLQHHQYSAATPAVAPPPPSLASLQPPSTAQPTAAANFSPNEIIAQLVRQQQQQQQHESNSLIQQQILQSDQQAQIHPQQQQHTAAAALASAIAARLLSNSDSRQTFDSSNISTQQQAGDTLVNDSSTPHARLHVTPPSTHSQPPPFYMPPIDYCTMLAAHAAAASTNHRVQTSMPMPLQHMFWTNPQQTTVKHSPNAAVANYYTNLLAGEQFASSIAAAAAAAAAATAVNNNSHSIQSHQTLPSKRTCRQFSGELRQTSETGPTSDNTATTLLNGSATTHESLNIEVALKECETKLQANSTETQSETSSFSGDEEKVKSIDTNSSNQATTDTCAVKHNSTPLRCNQTSISSNSFQNKSNNNNNNNIDENEEHEKNVKRLKTNVTLKEEKFIKIGQEKTENGKNLNDRGIIEAKKERL